METVWDWVTVFTFAGLATLLLQRSSEEEPRDKLWQYFPPAIGCAVVNYLGNEEYHLIAGALFIGVLAMIVFGLKVELPFRKR
ncbi:MAG: XrtV sorting system accessory protein [Pontixanthobacter sp.]